MGCAHKRVSPKVTSHVNRNFESLLQRHLMSVVREIPPPWQPKGRGRRPHPPRTVAACTCCGQLLHAPCAREANTLISWKHLWFSNPGMRRLIEERRLFGLEVALCPRCRDDLLEQILANYRALQRFDEGATTTWARRRTFLDGVSGGGAPRPTAVHCCSSEPRACVHACLGPGRDGLNGGAGRVSRPDNITMRVTERRQARAWPLAAQATRFLGDLGTTQDVPRWRERWGGPAEPAAPARPVGSLLTRSLPASVDDRRRWLWRSVKKGLCTSSLNFCA